MMGAETLAWHPLFPESELPPGEIRGVDLPDGTRIAIYNVDGVFYATQDRCTHGEASLSEDGVLCDHFVECSWHFGTFDVITSEPGLTPCEIALCTYPTKIENGIVHVEA